MRKISIALLLLSTLISLRADAFACSCSAWVEPKNQEDLKKDYAAVFLGRVTKIEGAPTRPPSSFYKVTMAVEENYLGSSEKTLEVFTAQLDISCGYHFTMGERYIIFTYKERNELHTGLCSGTRLAQGSDKYIDHLRSISGFYARSRKSHPNKPVAPSR